MWSMNMSEKRNIATAGETRPSPGTLVEMSAANCKIWEAIFTGIKLACLTHKSIKRMGIYKII